MYSPSRRTGVAAADSWQFELNRVDEPRVRGAATRLTRRIDLVCPHSRQSLLRDHYQQPRPLARPSTS